MNFLKKSILLVSVILTSIGAQALTIAPDNRLVSNIIEMDLSKDQFGYEKFISGDIVLHRDSNQVSLILHREFNCDEGQICPMVMPAPFIATLPLLHKIHTFCGSTMYIAEVDRTPVDGLKQSLVVVDNSSNFCPTTNYLPAVEATYSTFSPRANIMAESQFIGERFIVQYPY